jgi:predicted deacylase
MMIDAAPGTKTETFLEAEGAGDIPIRVPVGIVQGVREGPTLSAIAGVHGAEYCGIEAVIRLHRETDPQELSGTLITAIANLPAFLERSMYVCPVDNKNLGRFFPGDPGGTYSDVLAHHLFESLVQPADYVVDLHGGDLVEDLVVYSSYHAIGDAAVDEQAEAMALAFGAPFLVVKRLSPEETFSTGGLYDAAARAGKVAVLTEAGGQGVLDEKLTGAHFDGVKNMMRHCGMLAEQVQPTPPPVRLGQFIGVTAPAEGIFYPSAQAAQQVEKGQSLGELRDFFGNKLDEVFSPANAIVLGVITAPPMKKGAMLYGLGELTDQ